MTGANDIMWNAKIRIMGGVVSAISGLIFMYQSSFFTSQFKYESSRLIRILVLAFVSVPVLPLAIAGPIWEWVKQKVRDLEFSFTIFIINLLSQGTVLVLCFLRKYPGFHNKFSSCSTSSVDQYSLYSVGAFALLALLLSSHSNKNIELGLLSVLVSLTIDTSMDLVPSNLWYLFGAVIYSYIVLQQLRCHIESLLLALVDSIGLEKATWYLILEVPSAIAALTLLYASSFCKIQFKDAENLKGVIFIVSTLFLGFSFKDIPVFIKKVGDKCECDRMFFVKAMVKFSFFCIASMVTFLNNYPKFRIQYYSNKSCSSSQRNIHNVITAGSFTALAFTQLSHETETERRKQRSVKLGMFSFLLQSTMDTCVELLGNNDANFFCMFGAGLYCFILILGNIYIERPTEEPTIGLN